VYHGDLWDLTNGAYLMAWTAGAQREEGACVQIGGRWATTGTPLASPPGALPDRRLKGMGWGPEEARALRASRRCGAEIKMQWGGGPGIRREDGEHWFGSGRILKRCPEGTDGWWGDAEPMGRRSLGGVGTHTPQGARAGRGDSPGN